MNREPEREEQGEQEKADRKWLGGYSSSSNPMEGPLGGLARLVKNKPIVVVFVIACVLLLLLMTFLNPD